MSGNIDSVPPAREPKITTYEDLIEYCKRSEGLKKNHISALISFLAFWQVEKTAEPGAEFGADYEAKVSGYLSSVTNSGTRYNNKSRLKTLKSHWDAIRSSTAQSNYHVFHEACSYYFNEAKKRDPKLGYKLLATKLDSSKSTIRALATRTIQPNHSSLDLIRLLEKELGAPEGALTLFVKREEDSPLSRENKLRTEYDNTIAALSRQPYALGEKKITEDLGNDFQLFFNFKTTISVYPFERNEIWRLKPADRFSGTTQWVRKYCITEDEDPAKTQFAETGLKRFCLYRNFFGALVKHVDQDGNHPYDSKNFRFVWLADKKLVEIVIGFFHSRMGQYTTTAEELINFSVGLLLPKFGYVRQHREFGSQLPTPVEASAWEQWCDDQLKELKQFLADLKKGNHIKRARDPKVRIKEYLDRDHPISVLYELQKNIREYLDTHPLLSTTSRVVLERDYLLIRLITVQPLRIGMFKIMTYRKDNSGNLYRSTDGRWAIRFKPEDFKNETFIEKPYDVPMNDESIGRDIVRFFDQIRPKFKDDSDQVFVAYPYDRKAKAKAKAEGKDKLINSLANSFMVRTRQFLKDSMGFRPHACRHIVATDFLKHNPGQFQVAADMLHDKVETVMKNYAHLTAADGHKFYQEYLAGVQAGLGEKQSLGAAELIQAIIASLNKNKNNSIPADLRALLNKLTNLLKGWLDE
jgi:integrase